MRLAFVAVMTLHASIHLLGFVKAFGLARIPQLKQTIPPTMGLMWLSAALAIFASVAALSVWPKWWWAIASVALVLSQVSIIASWPDAKFGTFANVVLLVGVIHGFFTHGPPSFRAQLDRDVARGVAARIAPAIVRETDLARLPEPVRDYLRATGVVGKPRVQSYQVQFRGRIRSSPRAPWLPFSAEQQSTVQPPSRLFLSAVQRLRAAPPHDVTTPRPSLSAS